MYWYTCLLNRQPCTGSWNSHTYCNLTCFFHPSLPEFKGYKKALRRAEEPSPCDHIFMRLRLGLTEDFWLLSHFFRYFNCQYCGLPKMPNLSINKCKSHQRSSLLKSVTWLLFNRFSNRFNCFLEVSGYVSWIYWRNSGNVLFTSRASQFKSPLLADNGFW